MIEWDGEGYIKSKLVCDQLFVVRGVSFDAVSHEESIRTGRDEGMTWSHNLKAQEAEGTQQRCSVISVLMEADEDMVNLQLLFRKLQQESETVFAALRQSSRGDLDVDVPPFQRPPPDTVLAH